MSQANTEHDPIDREAQQPDTGPRIPWPDCSCAPEGRGGSGGCPCAGMLKKRHIVVGLTIATGMLLVLLATVTGSILGGIAFAQSL
jgi:hypothetical protein